MNGTVYTVTLSLNTTGNFGASVGHLGQKAHQAHNSVHSLGEAFRSAVEVAARMGERIGGALDGVADKALEVGKHVAEVGAVAGLALAAYGVAHLNDELEQTQVSLAAIFEQQGFTKSFANATAMAADQLAKMKQDVKSLPGDLGQLSAIMTTIATPAAQGGAGADQIRSLAGRGMLVGRIMGVQPEVVSRELANLLAGRAGAHNILGSRLGLIGGEAKRFNAESANQRVDEITRLFNSPAMNAAAEAFGHTWIAQITTLKDNFKYAFVAPITAPLFEHVKATIIEINDWFDKHKGSVQHFTDVVGKKLVHVWDEAVAAAKKLEPIVASIATKIETLSTHDLSHMAMSATGLLGVKVAGKAISGAGSMLGGALTMGSRFLPMMGGAEGAMGALGTVFTAALNPITIGASAAALGAFALAVTAVMGAVHDLTDEFSPLHDEAMALSNDLKTHLGQTMHDLVSSAEKVWADLQPVADVLGIKLLQSLDDAVQAFDRFVTGVGQVSDAIKKSPFFVIAFGNLIEQPHTKRAADEKPDVVSGAGKFDPAAAAKNTSRPAAETHITVSIKIEDAGDPSRVARLVGREVERIARNPTASRHVKTYTRADMTE